MKLRKVVCQRNGSNAEVVNLTLSLKPEGHSHHSLKCLTRECNECDISKFELLPEEVSEGFMEEVTWKRYECVGTG